MRSNLLILLSCVIYTSFAQMSIDSAAIKNKLFIEHLRNRIAAIENPNQVISELKVKEKCEQDSTIELNELIKQLNEKQLTEKYSNNTPVDIKEANSDLKNNVFVTPVLGDCNCIRIYYNPNQIEVDYSVFKDIDSLAALIHKNPKYKLKLVGHADKTGNEAHNVALSKSRVMNLKNYLTNKKSINPNNISLEWHGSAIPFKDASKPEKQFLNRRVELFLY